MHYELTSVFNDAPRGHGPHGSSPVSTELSLTFSSSKKKNHSGATHHHPSKRNQKKTKEKQQQQFWGCSTSLELYNNPWKIKKVLMKSDVGRLSRLLFRSDLLENLMLPVLDAEARRDAESGMGTPVGVWDVDTMSMHRLVLKRWASFKNFVLVGGWNRDFVRRRGLKKGDEVGFLWDSYAHCFHFKVLKPVHE